jgi:hypothetical protein
MVSSAHASGYTTILKEVCPVDKRLSGKQWYSSTWNATYKYLKTTLRKIMFFTGSQIYGKVIAIISRARLIHKRKL